MRLASFGGEQGVVPKLVLLCVSLGSMTGCGPSVGKRILPEVAKGEYGRARTVVAINLEPDKSSRQYMYDRMLLAMLDLADGLPQSAAGTVDEVYGVLRTQGLNADRTVASVVTVESIKRWKGEPFEQAMMFSYTAIQKAMLGEWDNARAAAANSLFLLKNFGEEQGVRRTTHQIAARALEAEKRSKKRNKNAPDFFDSEYKPEETTFALGYLLKGIANMALAASDPDRKIEAEEDFKQVDAIVGRLREDRARRKPQYDYFMSQWRAGFAQAYQQNQYNPNMIRAIRIYEQQWKCVNIDPFLETNGEFSELVSLTDRLRSGRYNTVLVVDFGLGPSKFRYGPYDALATFVQQRNWHSDFQDLRISIGNDEPQSFPVICDLNCMAHDHMWHAMEEVRVAKGHVGAAIAIAGVGAMNRARNDNERLGGAVVALIGLGIMSSARADIRHCEVMPQRVYVAPITITNPNSTVTVQVGDYSFSKMVLCGMNPPDQPGKPQLRYVRIAPENIPPYWATSGTVVYANDNYTGRVDRDDLPYILGGRCVKRPTQEVLSRYQQAGHLQGFSLADLESLYRDEGIKLHIEDEPGHRAGLHLLEGGTSMECPLAGTAGFARLFCQEHVAYQPRTAKVKELTAKYAAPPTNTSVVTR